MPKNDDMRTVIDCYLQGPVRSLDPTMPIAEAFVDSFAYVEMALELEQRFGVRLSDGQLSELNTVGDLATALDLPISARGIANAI